MSRYNIQAQPKSLKEKSIPLAHELRFILFICDGGGGVGFTQHSLRIRNVAYLIQAALHTDYGLKTVMLPSISFAKCSMTENIFLFWHRDIHCYARK